MQSATVVLRERFGLQSFRPGQEKVIDALITHGSALAVFPTGSGKSLCYQLPALLFEGVTVVVSPLIALMKDQIDFLLSVGVEAARLDSTLSLAESREVTRKLRDGSLRLLYVAPERFTNERFFAQMGQTKIALFAVDEAHCISEWGHNFRPEYLKLAETSRDLKVERVLALTATATPSVVKDICSAFKIPETAAIVTGFERPNLFLSTTPVVAQKRTEELVSRLMNRPAGSSIVYVTLQATAELIAGALAEASLPARAYHAGMKDDERSEVQEWWKQSDRNIVVATIAFGMGIDKADVRYVYHYNLPKGIESYSQEIGRAGRDGKPSTVELLGEKDDVTTLENFAYGDTPTREAIESLLREILGGKSEFDVSTYSLSNKHDIRALVLRTALTYLELLHVVRQGTPFYSSYKVRLNKPLPKVLASLLSEKSNLLKAIFENSKFGKEWYTIDPEQVATDLAINRGTIVEVLNSIEEEGMGELQVSGAMQHFTRLIEKPDINALASDLMEKFQRRELQEVDRVQNILELITNEGCQTNFLLNYFGDIRSEPCGHCTFCQTEARTTLCAGHVTLDMSQRVDVRQFKTICQKHSAALAHARQQARFLCGLSSPALTKAKLSHHPLFGAFEKNSFKEVLAWLQTQEK